MQTKKEEEEEEQNVLLYVCRFYVINQIPEGVSEKHFMCMLHQSAVSVAAVACVHKVQDLQ